MTAWANAMWLWSWQALVLIAGAAILSALARSRSAAQRYAIWLAALVVTAFLPIANALVMWFPEIPRPAVMVPLPMPLPLQTTEHLPAAETATAATRAALEKGVSPIGWQWRAPAKAAFWIWILGTVISFSGSVRSFMVYRRYRSAASLSKNVLSSRGSVPLAYSKDVQVPVLVGILQPAILLPARTEEWMTAEEQDAVILHELAHYERRDHWASLLQVFIRALLFFHPAVRYAIRQLAMERELACDERVLRRNTAPSVYGEAILKIAERHVAQKEIVSPAMNASGRLLHRRLQMIRSYSNNLNKRSFSSTVLMMSTVLALGILVLPGRVLMSHSAPPQIVLVAEEILAEQVSQSLEVASLRAPEPAGAGFVPPAAVVAQTADSSLSGQIVDQGGNPMPGVTVELTTLAGTRRAVTITNETGAYSLAVRQPGLFRVHATLPGFVSLTGALEIAAGQPVTRNFILPVAGIPTRAEAQARATGGAFTVGGGVTPATQAGAQASTARLAGRIFDQTGAVIPGVTVELRSAAGTLLAQSISNGAGSYSIDIREPGRYNVRTRLPGFHIHTRELDIAAGQAVNHNVLLRILGVDTMVKVSVQARAQEPPTSVPPEGPIRVGGQISQATLISSPRPVYPPGARAAGAQGEVVLNGVIGTDGSVTSLQVDPSRGTSDLGLIRAAMDAVRQWKYSPAMLNGSPIELSNTIIVNFTLEN